ncbi:MAG: GNAT family N-acetyltransferase [Gammaproteobacteria bacterium]|nr:GNAT family N-acetyltransferase [Gammaproteobacteria bacterium]
MASELLELLKFATEECRRRGNQGSYNLRASTYAIPVYEKWGFGQTGAADQEYGITSTPMVLNPE